MKANDTPALRFLNRGKQLIRLQARITAHMLQQAEAEQHLPISVETAAADLSRIGERVSDVQLALQLFLARHVDNFQTFLEDTIRSILTTQPGLLKRSESVSMKEVLSHDTIGSFLHAAIERKIHGLGYKSLGKLSEAVAKELDFVLFRDSKGASQVEILFDVRNLITHNCGEVNEMFLSRHPDLNLTVGEPYPLSLSDLDAFWEALIAASGDIEKRAAKKFKVYPANGPET